VPDQKYDDDGFVSDDAGLGHRLTRAIKHAIFGGGKDVNLPLEDEEGNPREATPREKADLDKRKSDQAMSKLQDFGRKLSNNPALKSEIAKARQRQGMSEEEATRKAIGRDDR
jgi:hypothetical protein